MLDAVIFDFDDTLVATNDVYDAARQQLYTLMKEQGIAGEAQWPDFLDEADIAFVQQRGHLSPECFPLAMRRTCEHFAALSGIAVSKEVLDMAENMGWQVYDTAPMVIDNAQEVLSSLKDKARLFLLTEGYPDIQLPRLQRSGFLPYFDAYRIVKHKNVSAYQQLIAEQGIDVCNSWMIGNSIRSDVNPALSVGLNMAFFTRSSWAYDHGEMIGEPYYIDNLKDLLGVLEA